MLTEQKREPRENVLPGLTEEIKTGCGPIFVTVNFESDDSPKAVEIFLHIGKSGGCARAQTEGIGIAVSYGLRSGASIEELGKRFRGVICNSPIYQGPQSCVDGIGIAIENIVKMWAQRIEKERT